MEQALRQAHVSVCRVIAADPTSTALLLAPTGRPHRLPTAYVARFALDEAWAVVRLAYADRGGRVATVATLTLSYDAPSNGAERVRLAAAAHATAAAFLGSLADAAESRADAA